MLEPVQGLLETFCVHQDGLIVDILAGLVGKRCVNLRRSAVGYGIAYHGIIVAPWIETEERCHFKKSEKLGIEPIF